MKEIERKFLVDLKLLKEDTEIDPARPLENVGRGSPCKQGYILSDFHKSLRVRIMRGEAFLTVKAHGAGITRDEFEYQIPIEDAEYMLDNLCEGHTIFKIRYDIHRNGDTWELDVFHSENEGLVVAEIELETPDQDVVLPAWVVKEVTANTRYLNVSLSKNPYTKWVDNNDQP